MTVNSYYNLPKFSTTNSCGVGCNYSVGTRIGEEIINLGLNFLGAYLNGSMRESSSTSEAPSASSLEKAFDEEYPEFNSAIEKAQTKLDKFNKLSSEVDDLTTETTNLRNKISDLGKNKKTVPAATQNPDNSEEIEKITKENERIDKEIKALEEALEKKEKELGEKKAEMTALGTEQTLSAAITDAKDKRKEKLNEYIKENSKEETVEMKKYNAIQKAVSPNRKAVGNFTKAATELRNSLQPGRNIEDAKKAATAVQDAYKNIQGLSTSSSTVASGIDAAFTFYEKNSDVITNLAAGNIDGTVTLRDDQKTIEKVQVRI